MMRKLFALVTLILMSNVAIAENDLANKYFAGSKNPKLTAQEKAALAVAEKWKAKSSIGVPPSTGFNGAINFVYGVQQPSIICAVLQVCDVALQPGEQVNSIDLGDTARWTINPAIEGAGSREIQHIIIKPLDVGIETSLIVTTNRRTYHFQLRSHRTRYMPKIAFTYPEDAMMKWERIKRKETKERQDKTIPETGEYLGDLKFDYTIDSDGVSWTPVRVYHDAQKTVIQMPKTMAQTEAPTLLVVRRDGGLFDDDETVMVNYRVQGDRYIVDTIFDKAILIAGVGSDQDVVTITRGNE